MASNAERGNLDDTSSGPGTITVSNSTDLNALAQAVALANFGENITIEGSNFTGTSGINIDAGTLLSRTVTIRDSTLAANVIKARAFNTGGRDALLIDSSRLDAGTLIRLYGAGQSTVRFRGDVQLNARTVQIAGQTVQVDAGSRVRSNGNVSIFTDNANFDRVGFGTIETSGSKTTSPHASRPSRF